jgi:hypothetical protein
MADVEQIFTGAPIKHLEGRFLDDNDEMVNVFSIETGLGITFFRADYEFAQNGHDFWILISNFGIDNPNNAGFEYPDNQRRFRSQEIESATDRIREYFSGPEEKKFIPFTIEKARFLGVKFTPGWAILKQKWF